MPSVATWMDLEIIIISEGSQRQISYVKYIIFHLFVESQKVTNELLYTTETDPQYRNQAYGSPKGKGGGRDKLRVWD